MHTQRSGLRVSCEKVEEPLSKNNSIRKVCSWGKKKFDATNYSFLVPISFLHIQKVA